MKKKKKTGWGVLLAAKAHSKWGIKSSGQVNISGQGSTASTTATLALR